MNMLILIIILPLISFVLLSLSCGHWSEHISAKIGISSIGLSTLVTAYIGITFFKSNQQSFSIPLWHWISVGDFNIGFNLILDGLSLTMIFIITVVGFLIHIFASWYMQGEKGYSRFFAYTNLFIANMAVLVLADNLLLMYLGWEGVGLCSYLLINFYYTDPKNNTAAMKAFITTRVSDVFLAVALFIIYHELNTLDFYEITTKILNIQSNGTHHHMLWWATLMILGGAIGKSAQLPLHTWLIDAMVSPAPVSALIHAATMVTAGVYLIARTNNLFLMNVEILHLVGIIGVITLILSSLSALVQSDIKRILAYSTISQIGYMFFALGVQAWNAAILHMMTHAFFKALLFLSSGSIIISCHREQNIFHMGGLRTLIPLEYICFLVGSATLPLISAGFFSKGVILAGAMVYTHANLVSMGIFGVFMTALYTFRMIFIVFHGRIQIHPITNNKQISIAYYLPLVVLLLFSTFISTFIKLPLHNVLPDTIKLDHHRTVILEIISSTASVIGIVIASWLWLFNKSRLVVTIASSTIGHFLNRWWCNEWGFNYLYNKILIKPFMHVVNLLKCDPLNIFMNTIGTFFSVFSRCLLYSVNGCLNWYLISISIGALGILTLLVILY